MHLDTPGITTRTSLHHRFQRKAVDQKRVLHLRCACRPHYWQKRLDLTMALALQLPRLRCRPLRLDKRFDSTTTTTTTLVLELQCLENLAKRRHHPIHSQTCQSLRRALALQLQRTDLLKQLFAPIPRMASRRPCGCATTTLTRETQDVAQKTHATRGGESKASPQRTSLH